MKYIALFFIVLVFATNAFSGGTPDLTGQPGFTPPLDPTLMGFKEHGTWYFLCYSPISGQRIPPHYMTFAPPPKPYCPPPNVPMVPPQKVHK
jgi:hypothetical protein